MKAYTYNDTSPGKLPPSTVGYGTPTIVTPIEHNNTYVVLLWVIDEAHTEGAIFDLNRHTKRICGSKNTHSTDPNLVTYNQDDREHGSSTKFLVGNMYIPRITTRCQALAGLLRRPRVRNPRQSLLMCRQMQAENVHPILLMIVRLQ